MHIQKAYSKYHADIIDIHKINCINKVLYSKTESSRL